MNDSAELLDVIKVAANLPPAYNLQINQLIADLPGWDSFTWVAVIAALEEKCQSNFLLEEIDSLKTVGQLIESFRKMEHRR